MYYVASQLARLCASAHSACYVGDGSIAKLFCYSDGILDSVKVGHPSVTFKSRQRECLKYVYQKTSFSGYPLALESCSVTKAALWLHL